MIHRLGRPARLALVSVLPACDSLLIRRPIGRYRATSKIERIRTLDPWSEVGLPSQPHQLTTEHGYHFRFTVLTEAVAQPDFSISAFAAGIVLNFAFDFERLEFCPPSVLHREIRPPTPRSKATVCAVTRGNIAELAATALIALLVVFAVDSNNRIQRRTV